METAGTPGAGGAGSRTPTAVETQKLPVLWETMWQFLKELNMCSPCGPGSHRECPPEQRKAEVHTGLPGSVHTSLVIAKKGNSRLSLQRPAGGHLALCPYSYWAAEDSTHGRYV